MVFPWELFPLVTGGTGKSVKVLFGEAEKWAVEIGIIGRAKARAALSIR